MRQRRLRVSRQNPLRPLEERSPKEIFPSSCTSDWLWALLELIRLLTPYASVFGYGKRPQNPPKSRPHSFLMGFLWPIRTFLFNQYLKSPNPENRKKNAKNPCWDRVFDDFPKIPYIFSYQKVDFRKMAKNRRTFDQKSGFSIYFP